MSHSARAAGPVDVQSAAQCMCRLGGRCTSYDPGHALHLVQSRLAACTPTQWRDAFVVETGDDTVTIRWATGSGTATFANAAGASHAVRLGEPVAVHDRYRVLAIGAARFNLREVG